MIFEICLVGLSMSWKRLSSRHCSFNLLELSESQFRLRSPIIIDSEEAYSDQSFAMSSKASKCAEGDDTYQQWSCAYPYQDKGPTQYIHVSWAYIDENSASLTSLVTSKNIVSIYRNVIIWDLKLKVMFHSEQGHVGSFHVIRSGYSPFLGTGFWCLNVTVWACGVIWSCEMIRLQHAH